MLSLFFLYSSHLFSSKLRFDESISLSSEYRSRRAACSLLFFKTSLRSLPLGTLFSCLLATLCWYTAAYEHRCLPNDAEVSYDAWRLSVHLQPKQNARRPRFIAWRVPHPLSPHPLRGNRERYSGLVPCRNRSTRRRASERRLRRLPSTP